MGISGPMSFPEVSLVPGPFQVLCVVPGPFQRVSLVPGPGVGYVQGLGMSRRGGYVQGMGISWGHVISWELVCPGVDICHKNDKKLPTLHFRKKLWLLIQFNAISDLSGSDEESQCACQA